MKYFETPEQKQTALELIVISLINRMNEEEKRVFLNDLVTNAALVSPTDPKFTQSMHKFCNALEGKKK